MEGLTYAISRQQISLMAGFLAYFYFKTHEARLLIDLIIIDKIKKQFH